MKNDAKAPRTPATMISMKRMPMFIASAIGESFSPKHTGHANAARGAATSPMVRSVFRISDRSAHAFALQPLGLPLERRAVDRQPDAARERRHRRYGIAEAVVRLVLLSGPRRYERGKHHRDADEHQVERPQRHVSAPRRVPRPAPPRGSACRCGPCS